MPTEFEAEQRVVHPHHGVGHVAGWEETELAGRTVRMLVVAFPRTTLTLRIPDSKIGSSGLRRLASRAEMRFALAVLPEPPVVLQGAWPRHIGACGRKLNSGEPIVLAGLVRDLNSYGGGGVKARSMCSEARIRLAEELAFVEGIGMDQAEAMIEAVLSSAD